MVAKSDLKWFLKEARHYRNVTVSDEFAIMLLKVGQNDVAGYKSNNQWLKHHPVEGLIFKTLEETWDQLKGTYESEFRAMVFGDEFPTANEILNTLQQIKKRLSQIEWTIIVGEN